MQIKKKMVWIDPDHETSAIVEIIKIEGDIYTCISKTSEIEATKDELLNLSDTFCCKDCGSLEIQNKIWIYTNGGNVFAGPLDDDGADDYYCPTCNNLVAVITVDDYLKKN